MKKIPSFTTSFIKSCIYKKYLKELKYYICEEDIINCCIDVGQCDCATNVLYGFEFKTDYIKKNCRIEFLASFILDRFIGDKFITFSDSERNNEIYRYMDGLKGYGFKIIEYPTADGKSIIKRAYYVNK